MFENNSIYKKYQRYNYNNYSTNRYNNYNTTTFTPMYNYFYEQSLNSNYENSHKSSQEKNNNFNDNYQTNYNKDDSEKSKNNDSKNFRVGPIQIEDNNINAFGFSIAIDDLIIIGLIILLFFQSDKDYTLIIILGLMLFNINFSNLDFFRGL